MVEEQQGRQNNPNKITKYYRLYCTRFNVSDLSTIGQEYAPQYPLILSGCAH